MTLECILNINYTPVNECGEYDIIFHRLLQNDTTFILHGVMYNIFL